MCGMTLQKTGTTARRSIDAAFSKCDFLPVSLWKYTYLEMVEGSVKDGLGISILPDKAVGEEIKNAKLVKSKTHDAVFSRNLSVIYIKKIFASCPAVVGVS
jgi:DNA-binding transcriptional LysR family regulator